MAGRAAGALLAVVALAFVSGTQAQAMHRGFIRVQDGVFVDQECREFNFVGANSWRWVQMAANQYTYSTPGDELTSMDYLDHNGKQINPVLWAIQQLQQSNVTVMRLFGAGVSDEFKMIKAPGTAGADGITWPNGKYNWDAITGLDKIVGWCRAHGIKVIISFLDNWSPADSKMSLIYAAGNATGKALSPDDFYSNELVKSYYKNHVSMILRHVNKQTGLQYKNDPTILGYNLLNEPRCNCAPSVIDSSTGYATQDQSGSDCSNVKECFTNIQAWVKEMAAFVKTIAPNQLIGVGDEGFATFLNNADSQALVATNPGDWAPITGDSFSLQSTRGIDYHSTHLWLDDWQVATPLPDPYSGAYAAPADPSNFEFHRKFISARAAQAASDGKPFVIEEFGKYIPRPATSADDIKRIRDPWFEDVFGMVAASQKSGGSIKGVIMWKYGVSPYHNRTDKNWVNVKDTTWTDIVAPLGKTLNLKKTPVKNCRPATGPAQARGMGISRPTTAAPAGLVKTMAVMRRDWAGKRKLLEDSTDDTKLSSYIAAGNYMMAVEEGDPIPGVPDVLGVTRGPRPCARACGLEDRCTAFHYNEELQRCTLRQNVGLKAKFDSDGWQTYWQDDVWQD